MLSSEVPFILAKKIVTSSVIHEMKILKTFYRMKNERIPSDKMYLIIVILVMFLALTGAWEVLIWGLRPSIHLCTLCILALQKLTNKLSNSDSEFLQHSDKSRGVLGPASKRKQASKQAGMQANRQAGKQASKQASKQGSRQVSKQASKQAGK